MGHDESEILKIAVFLVNWLIEIFLEGKKMLTDKFRQQRADGLCQRRGNSIGV
jgi:hypothetical protein